MTRIEFIFTEYKLYKSNMLMYYFIFLLLGFLLKTSFLSQVSFLFLH